MKRIIIIVLFFAVLFGALCLSSCGTDSCVCNKDAEMNVYKIGCRDLCFTPKKQVTLNGYHVEGSCIDCYWFPFTFGCYNNDFTDADTCYSMGEGAFWPPCSFVICGFDFVLLEPYGDDYADRHANNETRKVIDAVEGVHYTIDKFIINVDDHVKEFENGEFTMEDIKLFIKLLNMDKAATINFYVEYTALTDLHSVEFASKFDYKTGLMTSTAGFQKRMGNDVYGQNLESLNIKTGKHIIWTRTTLSAYELFDLESFGELEFKALAYEEDL